MNRKTGCLGNQYVKKGLPKHPVSPEAVLQRISSEAAIQEAAI